MSHRPSVYRSLAWFLNVEAGVNESGEQLYLSPRVSFLFGDYQKRTQAEVEVELKTARKRMRRIDARLYVLPALITMAGVCVSVFLVPHVVH